VFCDGLCQIRTFHSSSFFTLLNLTVTSSFRRRTHFKTILTIAQKMQIVRIPLAHFRAPATLDMLVMVSFAQISTSAAWEPILVTQKVHVSTLRARICAYAKTAMKTMSMDFLALTLTSVLWNLTVVRKLLTVPILLVHSLALAKLDILATERSALTSMSV
jgi:hypothetical protein